MLSARWAWTSTSQSIGRNSGASLFGDMAEYTHHMVAISPGLLARHDLDKRVTLPRIRLVLDHQLNGAVAPVDGPRKVNKECAVEAVEPHVAEMPLMDPPGGRRLTETRVGNELN